MCKPPKSSRFAEEAPAAHTTGGVEISPKRLTFFEINDSAERQCESNQTIWKMAEVNPEIAPNFRAACEKSRPAFFDSERAPLSAY